jgi:purine-binding chemotaxis protein CheW
VQEIIRMRDITRLPNAPSFIEGVINLRGRVIPVIGLRKRLGMESLAHGKETRIVIVEVADGIFGFEVDAVSEVLRISSETVEPPPRLKQGNNEDVSGIGKLESRLLLLLNMERLMSDSEQRLLREVAAEHTPTEMVN